MITFFKKLTPGQKIGVVSIVTVLIGTIASALIQKSENKSPSTNIENKVPIVIQNKNEINIPQPINPKIKKANIKLIQFTLNEDLCHFSFLYGSEKERAIQQYDDSIPPTKSLNPIYDMTLFNYGEKDVILTDIITDIVGYGQYEGSGPEAYQSKAIESMHKFVIRIPNNLYYHFRDTINYRQKTGAHFEIKKSILPPILISANEPARIQLEFEGGEEVMTAYDIVLHFKFSNRQVIKRKVSFDK